MIKFKSLVLSIAIIIFSGSGAFPLADPLPALVEEGEDSWQSYHRPSHFREEETFEAIINAFSAVVGVRAFNKNPELQVVCKLMCELSENEQIMYRTPLMAAIELDVYGITFQAAIDRVRNELWFRTFDKKTCFPLFLGKKAERVEALFGLYPPMLLKMMEVERKELRYVDHPSQQVILHALQWAHTNGVEGAEELYERNAAVFEMTTPFHTKIESVKEEREKQLERYQLDLQERLQQVIAGAFEADREMLVFEAEEADLSEKKVEAILKKEQLNQLVDEAGLEAEPEIVAALREEIDAWCTIVVAEQKAIFKSLFDRCFMEVASRKFRSFDHGYRDVEAAIEKERAHFEQEIMTAEAFEQACLRHKEEEGGFGKTFQDDMYTEWFTRFHGHCMQHFTKRWEGLMGLIDSETVDKPNVGKLASERVLKKKERFETQLTNRIAEAVNKRLTAFDKASRYRSIAEEMWADLISCRIFRASRREMNAFVVAFKQMQENEEIRTCYENYGFKTVGGRLLSSDKIKEIFIAEYKKSQGEGPESINHNLRRMVVELRRRYDIWYRASARLIGHEAKGYCDVLFNTDFHSFLNLSDPNNPKFKEKTVLTELLYGAFVSSISVVRGQAKVS